MMMMMLMHENPDDQRHKVIIFSLSGINITFNLYSEGRYSYSIIKVLSYCRLLNIIFKALNLMGIVLLFEMFYQYNLYNGTTSILQ